MTVGGFRGGTTKAPFRAREALDFHKLKTPHNNKIFLKFNITFFIGFFNLYMQIELSRIHEITLFFMV